METESEAASAGCLHDIDDAAARGVARVTVSVDEPIAAVTPCPGIDGSKTTAAVSQDAAGTAAQPTSMDTSPACMIEDHHTKSHATTAQYPTSFRTTHTTPALASNPSGEVSTANPRSVVPWYSWQPTQVTQPIQLDKSPHAAGGGPVPAAAARAMVWQIDWPGRPIQQSLVAESQSKTETGGSMATPPLSTAPAMNALMISETNASRLYAMYFTGLDDQQRNRRLVGITNLRAAIAAHLHKTCKGIGSEIQELENLVEDLLHDGDDDDALDLCKVHGIGKAPTVAGNTGKAVIGSVRGR